MAEKLTDEELSDLRDTATTERSTCGDWDDVVRLLDEHIALRDDYDKIRMDLGTAVSRTIRLSTENSKLKERNRLLEKFAPLVEMPRHVKDEYRDEFVISLRISRLCLQYAKAGAEEFLMHECLAKVRELLGAKHG